MLLSVLHRFATKNVHNVHFYGKESFGKLAWMSTKVGEPVPINFLKDGQDPLIKPDSDYPEWLWGLKLTSLADLKKAEKIDEISTPDLKRYWRLLNRSKIKEKNDESSLA
ncbi:unnamed protein product [Heterosigma akashiwo]